MFKLRRDKMSSYCAQCGTILQAGYRFCSKCGLKLSAEAVESLKSTGSVMIFCNGSWTGTISDKDGSRSINGYGNQNYKINGKGLISINAQKTGMEVGTLTIQILSDAGTILNQQSTTMKDGLVTVTHEFI
jgi:hypothetical protein